MSILGDDDVRGLIGLSVISHDLSADKTVLTIKGTRNGVNETWKLETEGDCCSHTWIESIYEENALDGYTITQIESVLLPTPKDYKENDFEVIQFYGLAIWTTRGKFLIDYRNSSNGYYGGWLNARKEQ